MSSLSLSSFSSLLAALAVVLVPTMVISEDRIADIWNNRLFQPLFIDEPSRHTPLETDGTYLPPRIEANITYTTADNPLLLTGPTEIPLGVTVTVAPGVIVRAHEFASLEVRGTLTAAGNEKEPIVFTTNEVHPDNQTWAGIFVAREGHATLSHTHFEYASPALSCLDDSALSADSLTTEAGLVGIYTETADCQFRHSRLQALQYGIVARGVTPDISTTSISAGIQDVFTTH